MKHFASTLFRLSTLVFLSGCGGAGYLAPPPVQPPQFATISGNWQFSTTSKAGMNPLTIAGSLDQVGSSVSGAAHVDGSTCFDHLTTMGLTGTFTTGKISLTSASIAGQVTAFTGTIANSVFTGTYTVIGGCADGDHGDASGISMPFINGQVSGTFTSSGNQAFTMVAMLKQGSASPTGSFGIAGTAAFNASCLSGGTVSSGDFPSASFILGESVALEVKNDHGTLTFHGTTDPNSGNISGDFTVSGSACDQTGTAVLITASPWDY